MNIEMNSSGELLELRVAGMLDNESATHFRETIDGAIRDGWHRILVRLGHVNYLSSAGIGALLDARKRLTGLKGFFGVCDLTVDVERILQQTRLLEGLRCDPAVVLAEVSSGTMTRMSKMRVVSQDGVDLQIYRLDDELPSEQAGMTWQILGHPLSIDSVALTQEHSRAVSFPRTSLGLGLGSLGDSFESCRNRLGEFLAVAGAVAQSPVSTGRLPDYSLALGDFIPEVQVIYGLRCDGSFTHLIRFNGSEQEQPIPLSQAVRLAMQAIDCRAAAVVVLGECAGLVGTQLRKSPAHASASSNTTDTLATTRRFEFPEIRGWLSYSAEQVHRHSLALAAGIIVAHEDREAANLAPLLRPFDRDATLDGHVHAAVFPYRPLKKRTLDLGESVSELFASGTLQDVLHLLRDDRLINGAGESEFMNGACWIAPIRAANAQGGARP